MTFTISKNASTTVRIMPGLFFMLTLTACATQPPMQEPPRVVVDPEPIIDVESVVAQQRELDDAERHRRYVADILYNGLRALRADRLMTPPEDSAFHYFNRALALDPGNTVAEDGLQDILQRYLQLADTASWQGQFDNAELFLRRAAEVDDQHPGIQVARDKLQLERQRTHSVYRIDSRGLRSRHEDVVRQLQDVAAVLAANDIFVLITAPSDETGRWIYAQLQDALSDQRVRADIEIGEQASVRLVLSQNS
ncbi:hypothetical protein [Pseudohongiella spirulinae]|uniref:Uncharacterized protein n=1 Tax=Pseudohongiella spirulinae TaxID=1249552 RepID=A0A0S2KG49_9GAMM|nr:hypothetical protein [Pseudohongiella spirulinae]ALO47012.1 hypothetical protein PS2015_2378 [Pseudohongiella spirulinae]